MSLEEAVVGVEINENSEQKNDQVSHISRQMLRRTDSLDIESRTFSGSTHASKGPTTSKIMHLAFQSIGIVYGDIGTSPLYVYASTFTNGINNNDDILGVLSLIFYTIIIVTLVKYVFIVLKAMLIYLSSALYKFNQGGYLPLAFAAVLMTIMYIWNNVYRRKYNYELKNKISPENFKEIANGADLIPMPGLALFYSELVHGIPPIFEHCVKCSCIAL